MIMRYRKMREVTNRGRIRGKITAGSRGVRDRGGGGERSADEGIADFEAGEPPEVPVGGPELADAVLPADRRHARVVDLGPGNLRRREEGFQLLPVPFRLPEQHQGRRLQPGVDLRDGPPDGRRGSEDPWMRGDGEKLVDARPRDRPGRPPFGQAGDAIEGGPVPGRLLAVGVDEEVGVDGDQPPRPS